MITDVVLEALKVHKIKMLTHTCNNILIWYLKVEVHPGQIKDLSMSLFWPEKGYLEISVFLITGIKMLLKQKQENSLKIIQLHFNGSNTDGSFITAVSNSFLSLLEQIP